jgi:glycerol-1-phosphate dehydrogenase [NAD(P)+]
MEFNKTKAMHFPNDVYIGHNAIDSIRQVAEKNLKSGTILIISGQKTYGIAGKAVVDRLHGLQYHIIMTENATMEAIQVVKEEVSNKKIGLIIGIGGGSKIDMGKKIAFDLNVPFISFPTAPSHDGIASPRASIYDGKSFLSIEAAMPTAIIADTGIMAKAPYRFAAAGASDVIANITAVMDWKMANRIKGEGFSTTAAVISEYSSRELIENANIIQPGLEASIWMITKQILASGTAMAIAGTSRPASGSEHLFAHALEILGPGNAMHGEQVAMGSLAAMYLHGGDWKMLYDTYKKIGVSTKANDYGIPDEIAIKALSIAHRLRPQRYTILGETDLSEEVSRKALKLTGVI